MAYKAKENHYFENKLTRANRLDKDFDIATVLNSSTEDMIKYGLHIVEHAVDPRLSGLPWRSDPAGLIKFFAQVNIMLCGNLLVERTISAQIKEFRSF